MASLAQQQQSDGEIVSLQPLKGMQHYPHWKTIDADLILFGSPLDNVLLFDQARGFLLPDGAADLTPGQSMAVVTYSPFVGERQALNLIASDASGLTAAVEDLTR